VAFLIVEMTRQIDNLTRLQLKLGDVIFIHQNHSSLAGDPAISVIVALDRRIELIVGSDRRQ
jgi:hypothetical protein